MGEAPGGGENAGLRRGKGFQALGVCRDRPSWAGGVIPGLENGIPDPAGVFPDIENVIPDLAGVIPGLESVILDLAGVIPGLESVIPDLEAQSGVCIRASK